MADDDYEQDLVDFDYDVDVEEDASDEKGDELEENDDDKNVGYLTVASPEEEHEPEVLNCDGQDVPALVEGYEVSQIDNNLEGSDCCPPREGKESRSPQAVSEALQMDGPDLEDGEFADPAMFQEKQGRKAHGDDGRPRPGNPGTTTSGDESSGILEKTPSMRRKADRPFQGQQQQASRYSKRGDEGGFPGKKRPRQGHAEYRASSLLAGNHGGGHVFSGGFPSPMDGSAGHFGPGMLGRGGQLPLDVQMALYNASMGGGSMARQFHNPAMGGGGPTPSMQDFLYQMSILRGQHMAQDLLARQTGRQPRPGGLNGGPSLRSPHPGISPPQLLAPPRIGGTNRSSSVDPRARSHALHPLSDLSGFRTHVHNGMILLEPRRLNPASSEPRQTSSRDRQGRHSESASWQVSATGGGGHHHHHPESVLRRGGGAGILEPPPFPPGGPNYRSSRCWDGSEVKGGGGGLRGVMQPSSGQHTSTRGGERRLGQEDHVGYKGGYGGVGGRNGSSGVAAGSSMRREGGGGLGRMSSSRDRKRKAGESIEDGAEGYYGEERRRVGDEPSLSSQAAFRLTVRSKVAMPPLSERGEGGRYAMSPVRRREGSFDDQPLPPPPPMPEGGLLPQMGEGRQRSPPGQVGEDGSWRLQDRNSPGVIQLGGPKMKSRTLMVSGLPADFSLSSVVTAFEQQGKVTDFSRKDVNFFITYDTVAEAVAAQRSFHRSTLGGNLITVGYASVSSTVAVGDG